jgi:excisionase family DNA binding protein
MEKLLTSRELAQAIGASESSLRRWTNSGAIRTSRTVGGHRRIPLSEAVRFVRETGATVVRPDVLGFPAAAVATAAGAGGDEALYQALLDGDAAAARGRILGMYLGGAPLAALFDGPLAVAMRRVGGLWEHDPRGVLVEHRATDICLRAVAELRQLLPPPGDDAPAAAGGAPAGDPYLLPSMMAAAVLADAGYRVTSLGADTPAEVLAAAAEEVDARLAWLSVSYADPQALQRDVEALTKRLRPRGTTLLVGGRGAGALEMHRLADVHVLASMSELAAYARGAGAAGRRHAAPGK